MSRQRLDCGDGAKRSHRFSAGRQAMASDVGFARDDLNAATPSELRRRTPKPGGGSQRARLAARVLDFGE